MKKGQRLWTREELLLAINLYCKLPFGKLHRLNPSVIKLSQIIGRTPSSIAFKLVNFASLDPSLKARGIKGASNTSKLDREIWNEFYNNWDELPFESEVILFNKNGSSSHNIDLENLPEGKTKLTKVKTRVNQSFFRESILASYNFKCCITGIEQPDLLIAGHIIPWSIDQENRMNPRNGIAINSLHDRAFEKGYISISEDYKILISPKLKEKRKDKDVIEHYFLKYENKSINLPSRFLPDENFLKYHIKNRFIQ